jgi:sodium-independent sulfate anion transporter 11
MRHKAGGALGKLPLIGTYRKDKARRTAQDTLYSSNTADGYLEPEPTVGEWVRQVVPTRYQALHYIADTFPCSRWLFNYNLTWFLGDLIAGMLMKCIPQNMPF